MKMRGTWVGVVLLAGLVATPAVAQDMRMASEKIVACQALEDAAERLDCFDAAATELSAVLAVPLAQAPAQPQVLPAVPSVSETQLIQQAATAPAASTAAATVAPPIQQASVDVPAEPESSGSSLPSWIPRITFGEGREVVREPDRYETTLTRIQRNNLGRHFFTTSEGLVWKQRTLDKIKAPDKLPTEIVLGKNAIGGVTLTIVETKQTFRVSRVE